MSDSPKHEFNMFQFILAAGWIGLMTAGLGVLGFFGSTATCLFLAFAVMRSA